MRNTAIMAVAVLVMGAVVYFMEIRGAEEREAAEAIADRLLSFESEDVSGMTLETAEATISLARVDDVWRITAPYDLAADEVAVTGIVNSLQTANRERVIDEAPDELERFGLAAPELSVTLQLADGDTRSIAFGGGTPVGFNVFVRTGNSDAVYTAAANIKDTANKTLYDLRDRSILTFADSDVARVEIERPGGDLTVARQPDLGDGVDRWRLSSPLDARADTDTVAQLLQRVRSGNAVGFAADEPSDDQLAEFGLVEPEVTLRLWTTDDAAQTLLIGGSSEEPSGRYARREGSDSVMIIPENLVAELPDSADAVRNRSLVEFARDRVNAIEIVTGDTPMRIEKDGVDWMLTEPRPLDGDASTASSLLTGALDLRAREFPEGSPDEARFGFAAPHARVSFELEALPGEDAGDGLPAETITLVIGAALEIEAEDDATPAEDAGPDAEQPADVAARYVRVEGDPTVFVVEQSDLTDIEVDMFELRSKSLVSFGQSELTRIEVITPAGTFELDKNEDGDWAREGAPVSQDQATAIDDMIWRLNYLNMQGIVAEPEAGDAAELSAYALGEPQVRVRAYIATEMVADVGIGADVPEAELGELPAFAPPAQTYATVGEGGGVYRIDAALRDAARALLEALS